jgi:ribosomal protein L40E
MLDEQSFQGFLAAAFTIQEHNDRIRRGRETSAEAAASTATEAAGICPHCGAPKPAEEQRCRRCRLVYEFRPGEGLQRNWASLWMLGQEQGLWPDPPPEVGEVAAKTDEPALRIREDTENLVSLAAERGAPTDPARDFADEQTPNEVSAEAGHTTAASVYLPTGDLPPEERVATERTFPLSASGDPFPIVSALARARAGTTADRTNRAQDSHTDLAKRRLADFGAQLRLHRADLYLGTAVVVAALALLWPAADSPRRTALRPWERALVTLGIAEAPAPATHFQGDPGIEVWVDPHTALYYCPGEDQYGKTAGGRFSSQRDAQMDRFEPASRNVCE